MVGVFYFCSERKGANRKRATSAEEKTSKESHRGLIMMNQSDPADYGDHGPLMMKDHDGVDMRAEHGTNTGTDGSATEHMEEPPSPSPTPSESPGVQQRRIQEAQLFAKAEEARREKEREAEEEERRRRLEDNERVEREEREQRNKENEERERQATEQLERERLALETWKARAAEGLAEIHRLCCECSPSTEGLSVEEVTEETAKSVKNVLDTLSAAIPFPVHLALDQTWQKRWLGEDKVVSDAIPSGGAPLLWFEKDSFGGSSSALSSTVDISPVSESEKALFLSGQEHTKPPSSASTESNKVVVTCIAGEGSISSLVGCPGVGMGILRVELDTTLPPPQQQQPSETTSIISKIVDSTSEEHRVLRALTQNVGEVLSTYFQRQGRKVQRMRVQAQLPDADMYLNTQLALWSKFEPLSADHVHEESARLKREAAEVVLRALQHCLPACCGGSIVEKVRHGSSHKRRMAAAAQDTILGSADWGGGGRKVEDDVDDGVPPPSERTESSSEIVVYPTGQTDVVITICLTPGYDLSEEERAHVGSLTTKLATCIATINVAVTCGLKFRQMFEDKENACDNALEAAVRSSDDADRSLEKGAGALAEVAQSLLCSICPLTEIRHGIFQPGMHTVLMVPGNGGAGASGNEGGGAFENGVLCAELVPSSAMDFSAVEHENAERSDLATSERALSVPPRCGSKVTLPACVEGTRTDSAQTEHRTIGIVEGTYKDASGELQRGHTNPILSLDPSQFVHVLLGIRKWFGFTLDKYIKAHVLWLLGEQLTSGGGTIHYKQLGGITTEMEQHLDGAINPRETHVWSAIVDGLHRVFPGASGLALSQLISDDGNGTLGTLKEMGDMDQDRTAATALALAGTNHAAVAEVASDSLTGLSAADGRVWRIFIGLESKKPPPPLSQHWLCPFFADDEAFLLKILQLLGSKLNRLVADSAVSNIATSVDVWIRRRLMTKATGMRIIDPQSPNLPPDVREMLLRLKDEQNHRPSSDNDSDEGQPHATKGKRKAGSSSSHHPGGSHTLSRDSCLALGLPPHSMAEHEAQQEVLVRVCQPPGLRHLCCIITALPDTGTELHSPSLKASEVMDQVVSAAGKVIEKNVAKGVYGVDKPEAMKGFFGHLLVAMQSKLVDISQVGLHEIKSYNEPPEMVVKVIRALFSMLSYKMNSFPTWKPMKQTFIRDNVWQKMIDLDPSKCPSCSEHEFASKELKPLRVDHVFLKASMPIAAVFEWALLCISLRTAFEQSGAISQ
jgi:hypothetical protein